MTAAQKAAKEKFSKAIAYRSKTGVSLKEAFAHVYGKKVGLVKKKAAPKKKTTLKKAAPKKKAVVKKGTLKKKSIISGTKKIIKDWTYATDADVVKNFVPYLEKYIKDGKPYWNVVSLEKRNGKWEETVTYRFNNLKKAKENVLAEYGELPKVVSKKIIGSVKRKTAPKKKAAAKKVISSHKDTKSHNVNIRVVSGIGKISNEFISQLKGANDKLTKWQKVLSLLEIQKSKAPKGFKLVVATDIKKVKDAIKEQKIHIRELKKNIK
jgi:hypothetical protein